MAQTQSQKQPKEQKSKIHDFPGFDKANPYGAFFTPFAWTDPSRMLEGYFMAQQKFWQDYWEWATWQQKAMQESMFESSRWMTHGLQLTSDPQTLYRYARLYWKKPYLDLASQALTSSRHFTRLWMDCWSAWQKGLTTKH